MLCGKFFKLIQQFISLRCMEENRKNHYYHVDYESTVQQHMYRK